MPSYYLSYIEIGGHAAIMVSEQQSPDSPVNIICEIGFAYSPDVDDDKVGFFTRHKGHIREETNASRVHYGRSNIQHRTYEISENELTHLFQILNRDRAIDSSEVTIEWDPSSVEEQPAQQVEVVGGMDYQKLQHNCKTYAMGILKELGIVDAQVLGNFFIQRTSTHKDLLEQADSSTFVCPIKDDFIKNFGGNLDHAVSHFKKLKENKSNILVEAFEIDPDSITEQLSDDEKEYTHESYFALIDVAIAKAEALNAKKQKVGIDFNFIDEYEDLISIINNIVVFEDNAEITAENDFDQDVFNEILKVLDEVSDELSDLVEVAEEIEDLSDQNALAFVWNEPPECATRKNFDNFQEHEKAVYLTRLHSIEALEGLSVMQEIITQFLLEDHEVSEALAQDMMDLNTMIKSTKQEMDALHREYLTKIQGKDDASILRVSVDHRNNTGKLLKKLQGDIIDFKAREPKKTNPFVRLFKKMVNFFRADYKCLKEEPNVVMNKQLRKIMKGNTVLSNLRSERTSDFSQGEELDEIKYLLKKPGGANERVADVVAGFFSSNNKDAIKEVKDFVENESNFERKRSNTITNVFSSASKPRKSQAAAQEQFYNCVLKQATKEIESMMKPLYMDLVNCNMERDELLKASEKTPGAIQNLKSKAYEVYQTYKELLPEDKLEDFKVMNDYINQTMVGRDVKTTFEEYAQNKVAPQRDVGKSLK